MTFPFDIADIDRLTGGHIGTFDVACPLCASERRTSLNRRRKVLRIWRIEEGFATFHCARCGEKGHSRDAARVLPDPIRLTAAAKEAETRERSAIIVQRSKARWLWDQRQPIGGTIAESYLRQARGYGGQLPGTLGFLPPRGEHGPAMIAAFGFPAEPEPGSIVIATSAVLGVHVTRLARDGFGKAGSERDKIMVGRSIGAPIVLAPANDLLGLAITEGIEDALTAYAATGLGAWAAASASRMPALADAIPDYIEAVTLMVDDDEAGRGASAILAGAIRRAEVWSMILPTVTGKAA